MGYLPQGDCGKIRPNPLTSAVPLTWARGFGHRINQNPVAADAKGDGWQGADRNWPPPNPRRRRFTKMGRDPPPGKPAVAAWPRELSGIFPKAIAEKSAPTTLITILVTLTGARARERSINRNNTRWPGLVPCQSTSSSGFKRPQGARGLS